MPHKTKQEDVSVIIPTKGKHKFLDQCIESVFNQNYKGIIKVIIVNDDPAINLQFKEKSRTRQITTINNRICHGPAKSRNIGLKTARGKLIAFLDSDDFWQTSFLTLSSDELYRNCVVGTCCLSYKVFEEFSATRSLRSMVKEILFRIYAYTNEFRLPKDLPYLTQLSHMLFSRKKIAKLRFKTDLPFCEDWIFVLNLLKLGNIRLIPRKLISFRFSKSSYTSQASIANTKGSSYRKMYRIMTELYGRTINTFIFWVYCKIL